MFFCCSVLLEFKLACSPDNYGDNNVDDDDHNNDDDDHVSAGKHFKQLTYPGDGMIIL